MRNDVRVACTKMFNEMDYDALTEQEEVLVRSFEQQYLRSFHLSKKQVNILTKLYEMESKC